MDKHYKILTDDRVISTEKWNELLKKSRVSSWFQTPMAYEFYACFPWVYESIVVAVENERGDYSGLIVGYMTYHENAIMQRFTCRSVIYGGPLLADDITVGELQALFDGFQRQVQDYAIYIETRNFSDYTPWRKMFEQIGFQYRAHYDIHVPITTKTQLWKRLHASKRRQIKHALSEGAVCNVATTREEVEQFYALLTKLYKKKVHRPLPPIDFFYHIALDKFGEMLIVKQKDKIIGGMACVFFQQKIMYEWYVVGEAVVTWYALQYAAQNGYQMFDFMGAGKPEVEYGVRQFKLQMGGKLHEYGRFEKILKPKLYKIGELGLKLI